jgi:hypothetical protein
LSTTFITWSRYQRHEIIIIIINFLVASFGQILGNAKNALAGDMHEEAFLLLCRIQLLQQAADPREICDRAKKKLNHHTRTQTVVVLSAKTVRPHETAQLTQELKKEST